MLLVEKNTVPSFSMEEMVSGRQSKMSRLYKENSSDHFTLTADDPPFPDFRKPNFKMMIAKRSEELLSDLRCGGGDGGAVDSGAIPPWGGRQEHVEPLLLEHVWDPYHVGEGGQEADGHGDLVDVTQPLAAVAGVDGEVPELLCDGALLPGVDGDVQELPCDGELLRCRH